MREVELLEEAVLLQQHREGLRAAPADLVAAQVEAEQRPVLDKVVNEHGYAGIVDLMHSEVHLLEPRVHLQHEAKMHYVLLLKGE